MYKLPLFNSTSVASFEFAEGVEEIFDVQVIPGVRFPEWFGFQKADVNHTFVVPPAQWNMQTP